jgi:hypothetical protein
MNGPRVLTFNTALGKEEASDLASVLFRNVDLRALLGLQLNTAVALKWTATYAKTYTTAASDPLANLGLYLESESFEYTMNSGKLSKAVFIIVSSSGLATWSNQSSSTVCFYSKPRETIDIRFFWANATETRPRRVSMGTLSPIIVSFTVECINQL